MPARDRTGPLGEGPRTGRGMGLCGGGKTLGSSRRFGKGYGRRNFAAYMGWGLRLIR